MKSILFGCFQWNSPGIKHANSSFKTSKKAVKAFKMTTNTQKYVYTKASRLFPYPCESQMHLQLGYPPANAAPDAVTKWNGAKVVDTISGMFPYPALRSEV